MSLFQTCLSFLELRTLVWLFNTLLIQNHTLFGLLRLQMIVSLNDGDHVPFFEYLDDDINDPSSSGTIKPKEEPKSIDDDVRVSFVTECDPTTGNITNSIVVKPMRIRSPRKRK